jgi:hypothetical protein
MDGAGTERGSLTADRSSLFPLFGVLLLATLLRFNQAGTIPLRADEAANLYLALKPPEAILQPLTSSDPHLPLFYILLHYWIIVAGSTELSLRYLTIFAAVLVVPLVYLLGRQLYPRSSIALIGALLAAINPYSIWDSQDAYMYTMLTATGLASFIAFLRLMRPKPSRLAWGAYVLFTALALYEHYLAGLILIAQGVAWLWWTVRRTIGWRSSARWLAAQLAIMALFAPWLALVLPLLAGLNEVAWRRVGLPELLVRTGTAFSIGRVTGSGMPAMVEPLTGILGTIPFLILFLLGVLVPRRYSSSDLRERGLLAVYLFAPLLAFFLFTLVRFPLYDERYVLFLVPPFLLLVARGVLVLQERTGRVGVSAGALLIVSLLSAHSLFNYWFTPDYAKSPDWPSFVRQLIAEYRPGDILIQNYPDPALPYYLHDAVPSILVPGKISAQASNVADRMNLLTGEYSRIWFQPVAGNTWDTEGLVDTWLGRHARFVKAYPARGLQLELFLRASTALENAQSGDVLFANGVRLLGFDVDVTGDSGTGTAVQVVLYWRPTAQVSRDATVFLHMYDEKGMLMSQTDGQPVHGSYPVHEWMPGEIVVDSHLVPIPPHQAAGQYQIAVGMYDSETEKRVGIQGSEIRTLPDSRVLLTSLFLK